MVLVQTGHFSNFFFLGNIAQENVFYIILQPKNAFLAYKSKKFKRSKNWHFSKVLVQNWQFGIFGPKSWVNPFRKMSIFLTFWTLCFYSFKSRLFVLEYHKRLFPGLYCLKRKVGEMAIFIPKSWVNLFGKISISRHLKPEVQKVEKLTFCKRGYPRFWYKDGRFSNFFFRQNRPGKCDLWYSRTKKRLSRL